MTINKELNGVSYFDYTTASWYDYSKIVEVMSGVELHSQEGTQKIYLAIDNKNGIVTNTDGKKIAEIEGAYEQHEINGVSDNNVSKIRRVVVPTGDYVLTNGTENADEDVNFYMATEHNFAQVNSTDETAVLTVSPKTEGLELSIQSQAESSEAEETTVITLMNEQGLERQIEIEGSTAILKVTDENSFEISVSDNKIVKIDGKEVTLESGKLSATYEKSEDESSLKVKELEVSTTCNTDNKLSGNIDVTLISNAVEDVQVAITTEYLDKEGNVVGSYKEDKTVKSGLNMLSLSFENLETAFKETEGNVELAAKLTISTPDGKAVQKNIEDALIVTLTKQPDKDTDEDNKDDGNKEEDKGDEGETPDESVSGNDQEENPGDNSEDDKEDEGESPDGSVSGNDSEENPGDNPEDDKEDEGESLGGSVSGNDPEENPEDNPEDDDKPNDNIASDKDTPVGDKNNATTGGSTSNEQVTPPNHNAPVQQPKEVEKVKASVKKILLGVGETYKLKTTVTPTAAVNKTLTYKSSNKKIKVDAKGKITAKKAGTAKITITSANGKKATVTVVVKKAPKKINLNATKKTLKKNKTFQIKVKLPKNTASNKITFTSSKKSVATVSSTGKVKAKKKGTTVITVKTFNGKKAKIKITVK